MKRLIALFLLIICIVSLVGCKSNDDKLPIQDITSEASFTAKILEIHESSILVEPIAGSAELRSADKISISLKNVNIEFDIQVGDFVTIAYDGMIAESYPAQILNVYKITQTPASDTDEAETFSEITLSVKDVTNSGLTIVCTHSSDSDVEFMTGSYYVIQKYDNGWDNVPTILEDFAWTMEAWIIPQNNTVEWDVNWNWLYGNLPAGQYRIGKEITEFRGTGNYDNILMFAEFVIE